MNSILKEKIKAVCDRKIEKKGQNVGLSFYAFFSNKNDNPPLLMEAAEWWIMTHKLNHFEKATKILSLLEGMDSDKFKFLTNSKSDVTTHPTPEMRQLVVKK